MREMLAEPEGPIVDRPVPSAQEGSVWPSLARRERCPTCGTAVAWAGNPQRPFCSWTCRLVDLGVWLDGDYVVEGESPDDVR